MSGSGPGAVAGGQPEAPKRSAEIRSIADVRNVKAMLDRAEKVETVKQRGAEVSITGVEAGGWHHLADPITGMPPNCPVMPLGVDGDRLYLLDAIGQVRVLDKPYGKLSILAIFGGELAYLEWAWPRWGKSDDKTGEPRINGFANEECLACLIKACNIKGAWESKDRVRGRGCWTDGAGNIVVHYGGAVMIHGRNYKPGEHEGHVYPTRPKLPVAWPAKAEMPFNPARLLRNDLRSWNWLRPEIDPHLLIGWIGAAMISGALEWRPAVYLTGDRGTGKSTLQALIKGLFGSWLLQSMDATPAGIYQKLGQDALAVALDEFEGEEDNRRKMGIIKLARAAASGGDGLRGGDRGTGSEFLIRSTFLFSSINAPPLRPADLSRLAILRLQKLRPGTHAPGLNPTSLSIVGQCVLRRLLDEWPRFHQTFNAFADELSQTKMDGRGQAQFGTLLTLADMIEHVGWDAGRLAFCVNPEADDVPWRELLDPKGLSEYENMTDNWSGCLAHMLSVRVEAWRQGRRPTVGKLVEAYFKGEETDILSVNKELAEAGLRIVFRRGGGARNAWLVIHNQGPLVRQLFEGSIWAGEFGAGLWSDALRQGPRGKVWEAEASGIRVNGVQARATLISLEGLYGADGIMQEAEEGEGC